VLADGLMGSLPVFFGAGKNELKPENRPPPPFVRARLSGGSSPVLLVVSLAGVGRLTTILPGLLRSTTFWNGFGFLEEACGFDLGGLEDLGRRAASETGPAAETEAESESESESES